MAMIEWLDERYPDPPLMPRAALKYLKSAYGLDDTKVNGDWYPHWIKQGFEGLEGFLKSEKRSGAYSLGNTVTMADICIVPQVFNAQRFDCDLKPYPTVMAIFERCMRLPAFSETQPSKQGDAA